METCWIYAVCCVIKSMFRFSRCSPVDWDSKGWMDAMNKAKELHNNGFDKCTSVLLDSELGRERVSAVTPSVTRCMFQHLSFRQKQSFHETNGFLWHQATTENCSEGSKSLTRATCNSSFVSKEQIEIRLNLFSGQNISVAGAELQKEGWRKSACVSKQANHCQVITVLWGFFSPLIRYDVFTLRRCRIIISQSLRCCASPQGWADVNVIAIHYFRRIQQIILCKSYCASIL